MITAEEFLEVHRSTACISCGGTLAEKGLMVLVATSQDPFPQWWCWDCVVPLQIARAEGRIKIEKVGPGTYQQTVVSRKRWWR